MLLNEKRIYIPSSNQRVNLIHYLAKMISRELDSEEIPIRFVITNTDKHGYNCELGVLLNKNTSFPPPKNSIFDYNVRSYENASQFNAVLLIPTGIGAEIGGHSGDGGAVARLLAASCDTLITHPNVVNASDINELPENALYVEGSVITRLLMGTASIQKVHSNRVIMVMDEHEEDSFFHEASINSASAARATLGLDCPFVVKMSKKILMQALFSDSGRAVGQIKHMDRLCEVLKKYRSHYDAVAISSFIDVPSKFYTDYYQKDIDMVNPWGGVEAMLTHTVSMLFDVPSAHSPMISSMEFETNVGVVDPRKSAEAVSITNLHCILKGLHRSPRIINSLVYGHPGILSVADISCIIIPDGCVGLPTLAALEQGIPVIAVKENKNLMRNKLEELPFVPGKLFIVENYMEAVGLMNAIKAGVTPESVRRPLCYTTVHEN